MAPLVTKLSHPDLVEINIREGSFLSSLSAKRNYPANSRIVTLPNCKFGAEKRYTSVQYTASQHFELDNEFVYMNHSCEPSVSLNVNDPKDIHVTALQDIKKGDDLTFFYPSTEWDMDQPFECTCGKESCLGVINGAKSLSVAQLKQRGFVNAHILGLKEQQHKQ